MISASMQITKRMRVTLLTGTEINNVTSCPYTYVATCIGISRITVIGMIQLIEGRQLTIAEQSG